MHKPSKRKHVLILTMLAGLLACGSAQATWCLIFPWLCPPPPPPAEKCDKCALLKDIRNLNRSSNNNTKSISNHTQNISSHTQNISNIENKNYNTTNEYKKWVTHNYYGNQCPPGTTPDECTGILSRKVDEDFAKLIGDESLDGYMGNYRSAADYEGRIADGDSLKDIGMRASANQKLANDALARTLGTQRDALKQQAAGVIKLIERGIRAEGHGNQLQTANALAGAQAIQLQEMRSLMLASENARAAQAQAEADREARELAASRSLRRGLRDSARSQRKSGMANEQY
ncbi:hypothetical protein ISN75_21740 [Dyella marensis]|uniref:hypothetical protein n=1 Tax=Dyella marensis TaxID=500610 RepID=UPI0031D68A11